MRSTSSLRFEIRVKNDRKETIVHDRHLQVKNNKYEKIDADRHETVGKSHFEKIATDRNVDVGGKEAIHVKSSQSIKVDGAMIQEVAAGSVAEACGLKPGDRILSFAGRDVPGGSSLGRALRASRAGETVPVKVLREGKEIDLEAKFPK